MAFTAELESTKPFSIHFDTLQTCKDMLDRIIPLTAIFDATLDILKELQRIEELGDLSKGHRSGLPHQARLVQSTKRSSEVFEARIQGVVEMVRIESLPGVTKITDCDE